MWRFWAASLHRWGVQDLAAVVLEALGPLTLFGAQAVYLFQPLLKHDLSSGHLEALAHILEDDSETQAFISYLREGMPQ